MDIADMVGLEFLDLSDVDECERSRVLTSLQRPQPDVKFPWYIGDGNTNNIIESQAEGVTKLIHPSVGSTQNYAQNFVISHQTPVAIVNPENGLALKVKAEPHISNNLVSSGNYNSPVNPPIDNQYFTPIPQYYSSPPPAVVTIPNVPVQTSPNYGHFPLQPEIVSAKYSPVYLPHTYPAKTSYYGVPPAQPIFVSHPPTVVDTFYPESPQVYEENSVVETQIGAVPLNTLSQVNDANIPVVSASAHGENIPSKKAPASPLSADTPAFTPKNQQKPRIEHQITTPLVKQSSVILETPKIVSNIAEKNNEVTAPAQVPAAVETDKTPPQETAWGGKKSWASLFESKGTKSTPQVNGVTKSAFNGTVNKGSSSNASCPIKNPKRSHFVDPDCYRMGEFLTNYAVDGRTISVQPRGLINQSNYCYINSILQALIACPPMYNLLSGLADNITSNAKRKPTPVIDGMCKFVKEYKHLPANMRVNNRRSEGGKKDQKKDQGALINTDIPFEPTWIYKILHGLQTDLMEGRQEDAEEFLGCLLNHLSDEMLELKKLVESSEQSPTQNCTEEDDESWQVMGNKNKGSVLRKTEFERTPITDIFGGSLKSRINRMGGFITENTQPFLTLPLNIEKVKTVREALDALTTKNQLEGLTSSKTNEEVEAWQQVMLDELPVVLILHLKCFDFKMDGCTKIVKALEFPIDLKIDGKLLSLKTTNAKEKQYKLFAIVYHDGKEASKGHYVTDAFHVGYSSWLRYDDASVKPVQEEHVLKPQGTRVPYLLFYRRSDTIRSR
ncbi:ubiquitin carboxyl-terminal hydrolase 10-B [Euwallacea fornicatus]|uniref:ubiquitin carboxyl-terminal hydrolase 10-B n=1 Tax=Euwallacea fornicatus TaxID=995702 RepID=UPI00338E5275